MLDNIIIAKNFIKDRDKMIKLLLHKENTLILNMIPANNGVVKYMNEKLIEQKADKSAITVGDFNTHLSIFDRMTMQKINKDIEESNNNINQNYLINFY